MSVPETSRSPREITLVVTMYEALPDVLARLRAHANSVVALEIPDGSPLFLTASEFRSLRDVSQQRRIALTIVSDDPLRRQLASVFSVPVIGIDDPAPTSPVAPPARGRSSLEPRPVPAWSRDGLPSLPGDRDARPGNDRADRAVGGPPPPTDRKALLPTRRSPGSIVPPPVPNRSLPLDAELDAPRRLPTLDDEDEEYSQFKPVAAKTNQRQPEGAGLRWPGRSDDGLPPARSRRLEPSFPEQSGRTRSAEQAAPVAAVEPRRRTRNSREDQPSDDKPSDHRSGFGPALKARLRALPGNVVAIAAGVFTVALVLFLLLSVFAFSSANVTVALRSEPVTGAVSLMIVAPGTTGDADVVIEGQMLELPVTYEGSIPTTGTLARPTTSASGRIRLSNPTAETVTIPAGTEITGANGLAYAFAEEVTVAAGDPGLGRFGSGEAAVEATTLGTDGNLGTGDLSGELESGVYYSNRDSPITGGDNEDVATVAPADIQSIRTAAIDALETQARAGELEGLPEGAAVVASSVSVGTPDTETDMQAGDEAPELSISASAIVSLLVYQLSDVSTRAQEALTAQLVAEAPAEFTLNLATVEIGAPELTDESADSAIFRVPGSGTVEAEFDEADIDALTTELSGKDAGDAAAIIRNYPAIASFDVDYAPFWLPDRMPMSSEKIVIETRR